MVSYLTCSRCTDLQDKLSFKPGTICDALEPLAQKLKNNTHIHGIIVSKTNHNLLLSMNDMLVLLTQPGKSVPTYLHCIGEFTLLSVYCINWAKSEAMPMSGYCPSTHLSNPQITGLVLKL